LGHLAIVEPVIGPILLLVGRVVEPIFRGSLDAGNPGRTLRSLLGTIAWQILKLRNLKGKLLLGCQFFIMHNAMVVVRWQ